MIVSKVSDSRSLGTIQAEAYSVWSERPSARKKVHELTRLGLLIRFLSRCKGLVL